MLNYKNVSVRMGEKQFEEIEIYANRYGMNVSAYIRKAIKDKIEMDKELVEKGVI